MTKSRVEILAPAGSFESMKAAVNAGADAVYMGGSAFGARAYAGNPDEDLWLEAIDYMHLQDKKLYMTVNTLVKQEEFESLYEYMKPYYLHGLDAAIIQDMGVFAYMRKYFPKLHLHASTQMTITGPFGADLLKKLGATRIVTARELSLDDLKKIHDYTDIEIESFVHGALCYCYSGQCLMSSLIGGRSGNRGRCAQPCRLPYDVLQNSKVENEGDRKHILSLKDLCTLQLLPDIIEAGVYSLKIEGRMKSPRYTAGVVSMYRKYVDLYLKNGKQGYHVNPMDIQMLLELFDRGGFTEGFYRKDNDSSMMALQEKPSFRQGNQVLFDQLDEMYVNNDRKIMLSGRILLKEGEPAILEATLLNRNIQVTEYGDSVMTAKNQPLDKNIVEKQIKKTGDSIYEWKQLEIDITGSCFLPVQSLNKLRRTAFDTLTAKMTKQYYRTQEELPLVEKIGGQQEKCGKKPDGDILSPKINVLAESDGHVAAALKSGIVHAIYIDVCGFGAEKWKSTVSTCHEADKKCYLALPRIFRGRAKNYFAKHQNELDSADFDGYLIRSIEELIYIRNKFPETSVILDENMYVFNSYAYDCYRKITKVSHATLPIELNRSELAALNISGQEICVYGRAPVMISASCVKKTLGTCNRQNEITEIRDRMKKTFPVRCVCDFCYNVIYNSLPLMLLDEETLIKDTKAGYLRFDFSTESEFETSAILHAFEKYGLKKDSGYKEIIKEYTRGHYKRGVE